MADFCIVSNRALNRKERELFRLHYLLGQDWKACSQRLGLPCDETRHRRMFFYRCHEMEAKLGRVFRMLQPYPLYPLDEYFRNVLHQGAPFIPPTPAKHVLIPPVREFIDARAAALPMAA